MPTCAQTQPSRTVPLTAQAIYVRLQELYLNTIIVANDEELKVVVSVMREVQKIRAHETSVDVRVRKFVKAFLIIDAVKHNHQKAVTH